MMLIPRIRFQEFGDEWKCTKMSACIEEIVGGAPLTPKDILDEGDFKIIPKKAIQAGGKITISDNCNYVKKEVYEKYNSNHTKKGDLIIVLRDLVPTGPSIGYIVENDKVEEGILAQGVYAFRTTSIIDNDFLIQYSNSPQYRKLMQTIMVGSTQVHIKNSVYMNIDMPHGELREQKKIADFLSSIDDIIQIQEEEIAALEEQKKGVMQKLFNREVRFKADDGGEYPEWEERQLENIAIIKMGQSPDSSSYNDECIGLPLIQGNADMSGRVSAPQRYTSEPTKECNIGDIIMTVRAPVGFVGKSIHHACIGRGVCAISSKINTEFLFQYLVSIEDSWKRIEQGSTFTAIGGNEVKKLILLIPCIQEQQKIADCLLTYDETIQIKKDKLEVWKEIKKGLLQQMFV